MATHIAQAPERSSLIGTLRFERLVLALPALIAALVYLPVLLGTFVWSDSAAISTQIGRPLATLSLMAELALWGQQPAAFHLTNLLLHTLNAALVTLLATRVVNVAGGQTPWWPALAGLLYALHPALVESVALISSRFDLLLATWLLLALLADTTLRERPWRYALVLGLLTLAAALSKETALAFVVVLPLWHLAVGAPERRPRLLGYLAVLLAVLAVSALHYYASGMIYPLPPAGSDPLAISDPLQRALLVGRTIADYLLLVVWPFSNLSPLPATNLVLSTSDWRGWLALLSLPAVALGLLRLTQRLPRAGWLALAGLAALLPVLNILPPEPDRGTYLFARALTWPLTLFILAAVVALKAAVGTPQPASAVASTAADQTRRQPLLGHMLQIARARGSLRIIGATLLIWLLASVATVQLMLPAWRDNLALWGWAVRATPESPVAHTSLALELIARGSYGAALNAAEQGVQRNPADVNARNALGLALFQLGRHPEAQLVFAELVRQVPHNPLYWANLAAALREQGQLQQAEQVLREQAIRLAPAQPLGYLGLGEVYLRADRPDLAIAQLQQAQALLPAGQTAPADELLAVASEPLRWLRLGEQLLLAGEPRQALASFEQAGTFGAQPADVIAGRAAALLALKDIAGAEQALQPALTLRVDDPRIYNLMGLISRERGDLVAARGHFSRAAELAPSWEAPAANLRALSEQQP